MLFNRVLYVFLATLAVYQAQIIGNILQAIGGVTQGILGTATQGVGGVAKGIGGIASQGTGGLTQGIGEAVQGIGGVAAKGIGGLTQGIGGVVQGIGKAAQGVGGVPFQGIGGVLQGIGGVAQGIGGVASQGIGGVTSGVGEVAQGVGDVAAQGVGGVTQGLGEVTQGVGEVASQGIKGVTEGVGVITDGVEEVAQDAAEGSVIAGNAILVAGVKPVLRLCANLKEMLGLSYSRLLSKNGTEQTFDELTLEYMSANHNMTFKISSTVKEILESEGLRYYNNSQKLYIFIHGFNVDPSGTAFQQIKDALYDSGRNNVLALDSSKYIKWLYLQSSTYVVFIGQKLAELLAGLYEAGLPRQDIHVIGHSLGAQISGYAGKMFQNLTGEKIGRITGLDPAGPCFTELEDDYRLKSTDADFVDAIHSNAGLMGIDRKVGQVDFYPNGGFQQPGCLLMTCSHGRAVSFFAESIKAPRAFLAVKCDSWSQFKRGECQNNDNVYMGYGAEPGRANGTYFLQTEGSSPYSLGGIGLKYQRRLLIPNPFL